MSILRNGICSSLTNDILEKLRSNGILKITDLISRDLEDTCQLTGISYKVSAVGDNCHIIITCFRDLSPGHLIHKIL